MTDSDSLSIDTSSVIKEYLSYYRDAMEKYGPNTLVLVQYGTFYDVYGIMEPCDLGEPEGPDLVLVSKILDYQLFRKPQGFHGVGFNCDKLESNLEKLFKHYAKIVIVDEIDYPPGKRGKKTRRVKEILTVGTHVTEEDTESKYITHLLIEEMKASPGKRTPFMISLASFSSVTGQCELLSVSSGTSEVRDPLEIVRTYLSNRKSVEVRISTLGVPRIDYYLSQLHLELGGFVSINSQIKPDYFKASYQNAALKEKFPQTGTLTPIEWLELERYPELIASYLLLIDYVFAINKGLVSHLERPTFVQTNDYLALTGEAISQLGLDTKIFDIFGGCSTKMGERLLQKRICYPLVDPEEIEKRYEKVDRALEGDRWKKIQGFLKGVVDIEKFHHRLHLGRLSPSAAVRLYQSYEKVREILEIWGEEGDITKGTLDRYLGSLVALKTAEAMKYGPNDKITTNIFNEGYCGEIDALFEKISDIKNLQNVLVTQISSIVLGGKGRKSKDDPEKVLQGVYIKSLPDGGFCFKMTKKRFETLKLHLRRDPLIVSCAGKTIQIVESSLTILSDRGNDVNFTNQEILTLSSEVVGLQEEASVLLAREYRDFSSGWSRKWMSLTEKINNYVAEIDVYTETARVAVTNNYHRPQINVDHTHRSFVRARDLRHPIIERESSSVYVPQSLTIGTTDTEAPSALLMLLYGMNTAGKSSLMKSFVSLVLAQAGLFVPARVFEYYPYRKLFTRILTTDKTERSSFQTEMSELGPMVTRSDEYTLILSDELCHSTNSTDAQAILLTTLLTLSKRGASGILTTHIAELCDHEEIFSTPGLEVYHLEMLIEGTQITHKRRLQKGAGPKYYGVEVAALCGLPQEFISEAFLWRRKILGESETFYSTKKSRYSPDVYIDHCNRCGEKDLSKLETHHLVPQKEANTQGFAGSVYIHTPGNLEVLCKVCHDKETYSK